MRKNKQASWYKQGLGILVFCIIIGVALSQFDFFYSFNEAWIDRDIRTAGWVGELYYVVVFSLLTSIGAPRQMVAFLGGYAFGFALGLTLAMLATLLGCMLAFFASRFVFRRPIRQKYANKIVKIDAFLKTQPTRKTIIIRLLPVGSNLLTNILAGAISISALRFFWGSAIGYLPQMIIFSLLGKGLLIDSHWKITLSIVLFFISSYLSFRIYKSYPKQDGLENITDAGSDAQLCSDGDRL
jgi:uncharacterized membrane protein YdjX (TVP38/TMEM64 family)